MNHATQLIEEGTKQFTNLQFTPAQKSFEKALKQDPRSIDARIDWLVSVLSKMNTNKRHNC